MSRTLARPRRTVAALAATVLFLVVAAASQAAPLAAPTAITGTVSALGGTTATLNGTVNPNASSTDWWFEYGTSTSYGTKTTTTDGGSGSTNVSVSKALSGLSPATTYHYRLVAKSSSGTTNGSDGIFTTASAPVAVTSAATGVGPAGATVGGTVNPNGQPTDWYVEYGTTTSYGSKSPTTSVGSGTASLAVTTPLTGLAAGKTYHFRIVATSDAGTARGADASFVTAEPPAATTSAASAIGSTTATLNGKVDPNGRAATYLFEFGTTTAYGSKTTSSSAGSGTAATSVTKGISGLKQGIVYHFRIVATTDAGTVRGGDLAFTTQSAPVVTTGAAASIGPTTATLAGTLNPNGRATTWYVEYGTTTTYGAKTSARSAGSGSVALTVTANVTGLKPGQSYHYRVVATSSLGTSRGADAMFVTTGTPSAATGPIDFPTLSLTSVRVSGTVNARGIATKWWFEYGRTSAYGFRTAVASTSGAADTRVTASLSGLGPGVRWHYRLVAQSAAGASVGADASFGTPAQPRDPSGHVVRCTITGTQAADRLRGTPGRDVICGLGGNDVILGGGGADVIYGGPGADVLDGGVGNDVLRSGAGDDDLRGRSGIDVLDGGAGADRLTGGTGRDRIIGRGGADVILAKDGAKDTIDGGGGRDVATIDRGRDIVGYVERRLYG